METELYDKLENKISEMLARYTALKEENELFIEENRRLQQEHEMLRERINAILSKLEGV